MTKEEKIVKHYSDELEKYVQLIIPEYRQLIHEERKPYLEKIDSLSDLYFFLNYLLDKKAEFFNQDKHKPFALFYSKVASDILSVRQCLLVGQILSATSIERNIFETFVDTKLLLEKDTEERLTLYEDYQRVQIWLRLQEYIKYFNDLESDNSIHDDIKQSEKESFDELFPEDKIVEAKSKYENIKKNYHPKYPYHWAWKIFNEIGSSRNPSVSSICKHLGIYPDYLHVYSTNSIAVHNLPLMSNFLEREGGISSVPNFNKSIESIAGISMSFAIEIVLMVLDYIQLPEFEEIKLYLNNSYRKIFVINN